MHTSTGISAVDRIHPVVTNSTNQFLQVLQSIRYIKVIAFLVSIGIFSLDILTDSHAAIGVLYIVSMVLLINQNERTIYFFAAISSVMLVLDVTMFAHASLHDSVLIDKAISFIALWVVTVGMLRYKALNAKKDVQKQKHARAIEEVLFMTSHNVRKPVCTIQGLAQIMEGAVSHEEAIHIVKHIRISADELDRYTEDLTKFVHEHAQLN